MEETKTELKADMKMEAKDNNATEANMVQFQPPSVEISSKCHKGVGVAACMENMMYKLEKTNNHF